MDLTSVERDRYERNLLVEGFDLQQQQLLKSARVCVVGAGGLGSAVLSYLVAVGVGTVKIIENDTISLSNLQRQILYDTSLIGCKKADEAARRLSNLNPHCNIEVCVERLNSENATQLLTGYDLIVECSDNYLTRYVIDEFCARNHTPMVYGTAEQTKGQISVFNYLSAGRYADLYPQSSEQKPVVGVLSPVVGIVGSIQAMETVKIITGIGTALVGRLLCVDAGSMIFNEFQI